MSSPIGVGSFITLRSSHNAGVAFGLGYRMPGAVVVTLTVAVTGVLAVAAVRGLLPSRVAAGLVLGGAVANLVDRAIGGTMVDFLDLGWWPSFNGADVALSVSPVCQADSSCCRSGRSPASPPGRGYWVCSPASRQASTPA